MEVPCNKILIYEPTLQGHRLEYLNHIYSNLSTDKNEFIFAVPEKFKEIKDKLQWETKSNVTFKYLPPIYPSKFSIIQHLKSYLLLWKCIRETGANEIFLITLMQFIPCFLILHNVKISGIIYSIYLYNWNKNNIKNRILDVIKYLIFSKSKLFKYIYILNDAASARYLNRLYHCNKFKYIPDPFVPIKEKIIQSDINFTVEKKNILHFGGLSGRKGTLTILKSIELMSEEELRNYKFIFAGKIYDDIKLDFYHKYETLKYKVDIHLYDEFCDYEFLGFLCRKSDLILLPYSNTSQSSGVVGYAAQFGIPVLGPAAGLLGKIIRRNKLGYTIANVDEKTLSTSLPLCLNEKHIISSVYIENNNVSQFANIIFNDW